MEQWKASAGEAIALYSYQSTLPGHLNLLAGDNLKVLEKNGNWVRCKCLTSSCVGICPANRLEIARTRSELKYNMQTLEIQYLLKFLFSKFFVPTHQTDKRDAQLFDKVIQVQSMLPVTAENSVAISKNMDQLRLLIQAGEKPPADDSPVSPFYFPALERTNKGELIRVTEYQVANTGKTQAGGTVVEEEVFAQTSTINFDIQKVTFSRDVMISPRLIHVENSKGKEPTVTVISSPADQYVDQDQPTEFHWSFQNIDRTSLKSLFLEIRVFTSQRFGNEKVIGPWGREYMGIGIKKIIEENSQDSECIISVYHPKNNSLPIGKALSFLIAGDMESLLVSDNVPTLAGSFNIVDTLGQATRNEEAIPCRGIPVNIGPKYQCNDLFVRIKDLHHKSALKRTRVVLHVLDVATGKYIEAFHKTKDSSEFTSVVQKGVTDMPIDDDVYINLSTPDFNPSNCVLLFEITRPSRSKGTDHLSSYCFYKLTNEKGIIEINDHIVMKILKPPAEKMTSEAYQKLYNDSKAGVSKSSGEGGELSISLTLTSTIYTVNPAIHVLINQENGSFSNSEIASAIDQIEQADPTTLLIFLSKCISNLAKIIVTKPDLKSNAINGITKIFEIINKFHVRQPNFTVFYLNVLNTQFVQSQSWMSTLGSSLLDELQSSLNDITDKGKNACRCMNYFLDFVTSSLKLRKEIESSNAQASTSSRRSPGEDPSPTINEGSFRQTLKNIVQSIQVNVIQGKQIILQGFVLQTFPMLVNILETSLPKKDAIETITGFFKCVNESTVTTNNQMRLHFGILDQKFFADEECRKPIIPYILSDINKALNTTDKPINFCVPDDADIAHDPNRMNEYLTSPFAYLEKLFMLMMKSSKSFQEETEIFIPFVPHILKYKRLHSFALALLYFMPSNLIAKMILDRSESERPDAYSELLDTVKGLLSTDPLLKNPSFFFAAPTVFIKLTNLSKMKEFSFIHQDLKALTNRIASFYNEYIVKSARYCEPDRIYYGRTYPQNMEPLAALLPELLKSAPISIRFNPQVILPLFDFYINQEDEGTRQSVAEGFFYVIDADLKNNKNFTRSENAIVNAMDTVSTHPRMKDLLNCFATAQDLFRNEKNSPIVVSLFDRLKQLNAFMYDLGKFPNEPRYEDELAFAITQVLNTCKDNKDYTLFPHFTSKLYELHIMMDNKVEAAETLVLAANVFDWNDHDLVGSGHGFPEQEKCERKRKLLHKAAELYTSADFYEKAIDIYNILADYYKNIIVDYQELTQVLDTEAKIYKKITDTERACLNRFYGVRFYGPDFSEYYSNQLFIYRRGPFFMNDQMMRELSDKFPNAKVSPKPPSTPEEEKIQLIHVFNVKPRDVVEPFNAFRTNSDVVAKNTTSITEFYSETPLRKRRNEGYGEFAEWHRIIIRYHTAGALEGIVRREKVIKEDPPVTMIPVQCAVYDTNAKTMELMALAGKYWRMLRFKKKTDGDKGVSNFSMLLNGIVSAAVNGGTEIFQKIFLEGPMKDEPDTKKYTKDLRDAFSDQLKAVGFAIIVHEQVVSEVFLPLHVEIDHNYQEMVKKMTPAIGDYDPQVQPHFGEIPPTDFLNK